MPGKKGQLVIGLLDWLEDPRADRGIRFAVSETSWEFVPYATLTEDVLRVAEEMCDRGVERGAVVSMMIADERRFIAALFACLVRGCTPSPLATPFAFRDVAKYTAHVARVIRTAGTAALLTDEVLGDLAVQAVSESNAAVDVWRLAADEHDPPPLEDLRVEAPDLALLQFTSGSSAAPKGVRVSWRNLESNLHAIHSWLQYTDDDATATWLPLYHDMGLVGTLLAPLVAGSNLWQMSPVEFVRSPDRWLECFGRHGATITASPNFGFAYAVRRSKADRLQGSDFSRFRVAITASDRIDPVVLADFARMLSPFGFDQSAYTPAYGLAEATLAVTGFPPGEGAGVVRIPSHNTMGAALEIDRAGIAGDLPPDSGVCLTSCGRPLVGTDVRVVGEGGRELPEGRLGEIVVVGESVARGYQWAPGDLTDFPAAGFSTGDAGFLHDGDLYVLGRICDSIKVRGQNLYAEDMELELTTIDGLSPGRCAVAFTAAEEADGSVLLVESQSVDWLGDALFLFRRLIDPSIRVKVFRAERGTIPRTSSGKTRRRLIWETAVSGDLGGELIYDGEAGADAVADAKAAR